jgi:hypothetical protein
MTHTDIWHALHSHATKESADKSENNQIVGEIALPVLADSSPMNSYS